MTATGQIITLPASGLVHARVGAQEPAYFPRQSDCRPEARYPRIYRIPRMESWVSNGVYGADGRVSHDAVTGERVNLLA